MNKSLKFLAIGLALAVLLVSQVGVDRSAVAHVGGDPVELVSLDQDEVMFVDHHGQEKMYYKFGDMVHFLLRDNDLAQDTSRFKETVTWVLETGTASVGANGRFNLVTGAIGGNDPQNDRKVGDDGEPVEGENIATTTAGTVTATLGDVTAGQGDGAMVTFSGTDFPPADNPDTDEDESDVMEFGPNAFAGGFKLRTVDQGALDTDAQGNPVQGTATTTDDYDLWERGADAEGMALVNPAELTPLVEKPLVKIGYQSFVTRTNVDGDPVTTPGSIVLGPTIFVISHDPGAGTFTLLLEVPVVPTADCPAIPEGATGIECRRVIQATFNYHIVGRVQGQPESRHRRR